MDSEALLCSKGELAYLDMLESLREGTAQQVQADAGGILLCVGGTTYDVAVFDEEAVVRFAQPLLGKDDPIAVHEGPMVHYLSEQGLSHTFSCIQAAYLGATPVDVDPSADIRILGEQDLKVVVSHYHMADVTYIKDRIAHQAMIGLFVQDRLAGFIGRHQEGAMGMLEVLPSYRRQGFGRILEGAYINLLLKQGRIPYCHVVETNHASLRLQQSLGLVFSDQKIHWFN
ncbi:MAG: GNAT family N-acetyltransferase [Sphaerochaeta sp.]|jgi:tRNA (guanine37-N1)-methyltransferase|uniref:GNAT family N-acetyltransferase n=1 Tax=Sphaerochaeta sp. TaxID=1972642 RepID=UPI002FCA79FC